VDNVLLNPGAQQQQPQGGVLPNPNERVKQLLDSLEQAHSESGPGQDGMDRTKRVQAVAAQIPQVLQTITDEYLKGELDKLHYLATMAVDKKSQGDGDWRQKIAEIRGYLQTQQNSKTGGTYVEFNWERHAAEIKEMAGKKKKKTKGNPFKVLMGQVGKLLDHGVSKSAIVRHLSKSSSFDEDTIDRAVDIVKEYNRKKQRQDDVAELDGASPDTEADAGEETQTLVKPDSAKSEGAFENPVSEDNGLFGEDERDAGFNYERWVESQRATGTARDLYEAKPQWEKRSTAELFARLQWLNSLEKYGKTTPQGDGRAAADKAGASSQMGSITAELKARGFNQEEIDGLLR
jgi:hypothetical protein